MTDDSFLKKRYEAEEGSPVQGEPSCFIYLINTFS